MDSTNPIPQRGFTLKPLHVVGLAIILLAVVYGGAGFQNGFRSYTQSIDEAVAATRSVQLAGFLGSTGEYDEQGRFTFMLQDETGKLLKIVSHEPRPANFEHAISIVAIGRYDRQEDAFISDQLLVKCPSKYQEVQTQS